MTTTKIKYITNKDLLSEIHRSKNTYCSFVNEEVSGYDAIVSDVSSITPELIDLTRVKRAAQLMAVERARQKLSGIKNYAISIPIVDPMSIPIDRLVFRVMTYEHVPLDPDRKRKNRNSDQSYSKTNFPPFKHYVIKENELTEVGRSHWCGSISNGKFDPQGGRMSPHLARMFMMLVERYSRRGNWRGYSYVDEMRSHALLQLSQIGLQFDESKSANPFAFYTTAIKNCVAGETMILTKEFGSVSIEQVANQRVHLFDGNNNWTECQIHDHGIQETHRTFFQNGGGTKVELWSTAEHGWISDEGEKVYTKDFLGKNTRIGDLRPRKTVTSQESYHQGIAHGIIYGDGSNEYGDRYTIRLCAEKIELAPFFKRYPVHHYPSFNGDPLYVVHSDIDLKALPENPSGDLDYLLGFFRGWFATDGCVSKATTPTLCGDIAEHAWLTKWGPLVGWHVNGFTKLNEVTNFGRRKKVSLNFHLRKSSMDADDFLRSQHRDRWLTRPETRKGKETGRKYDWALVESLLAQGRSTAGVADKLGVKVGSLRSALCQHRKSKVETGRVWHVYGSRQEPASRMERVYCPVVETTHSFALSDGVHTSNCFTRILNLEKKNQSIRDDLLLLAGAGPSYTRQVENELEYRFEDEQRAKAKGKASA